MVLNTYSIRCRISVNMEGLRSWVSRTVRMVPSWMVTVVRPLFKHVATAMDKTTFLIVCPPTSTPVTQETLQAISP